MSLASLDLNLLLVLDTVLAERSVVRAARRLHVTPSAVSNALARLRGALDDPLIARSGRGIVPTPRTAELAPTLARALRDLDQALHAGGFDPATTTREFSLAIADAGQIVWLPALAVRLAAEMPRARLRVVGIDTLVAAGGLATGDIDVAVGRGERAPGIHLTPVCDERSILVVRRDHPRIGAKVSRAALGALRHVDVHVAAGKPNRDLVKAYAQLGIARDIAVVVPTFTAAAAVVAATDLVATLPVSLVAVLAPGLPIRTVATPVPLPPHTLNLVWHERTHHDPGTRAFRDLVMRSVAPGGTR